MSPKSPGGPLSNRPCILAVSLHVDSHLGVRSCLLEGPQCACRHSRGLVARMYRGQRALAASWESNLTMPIDAFDGPLCPCPAVPP